MDDNYGIYNQIIKLFYGAKRVMRILVIKPTRCTNSQIYFWNKSLHVSDSLSVHHQEFFTVHTAMLCVIQALLTTCEQDQDGTQFHPDPSGVFHCTHSNCICHTGFADNLRAGSGRN